MGITDRSHVELPSRLCRSGSVQWRLHHWVRLRQQQMRLLQVLCNGLCKTARTPMQRSCSRCRPKPHGTAQQDMQVRLSVVALTPSGPRVAAAHVTATLAKILAFPEQRLLAKEWHFTVVARE